MKRVFGRKKTAQKSVARVARNPHQAVAFAGIHNLRTQLLTNPTSRVCVIRGLGGIGDVLMCLPVLKEIKKQFPESHLTFAVNRHDTAGDIYYELVKNVPFIDELVDSRFVQRDKYAFTTDITSVCMAYEHSGRPNLNRINIFARACGFGTLTDFKPFYAVEVTERNAARVRLASFRQRYGKVVVLHTASMDAKRCWPIEHCVALVKSAPDIGFVILDWNKKYGAWGDLDNCLDCSDTTVREMAAIIEQANVFIGPDSGPMHLAGAIGTVSLVLFGSIPPLARINHYPTHIPVVRTELSCIGCWYAACNYDVRCMKEILPSSVLTKLRALLESS